MSALPADPLFDPLRRFLNAVKQFLTLNGLEVEPPQPPNSGNPLEDQLRGWEELKAHVAEVHAALRGAAPGVDETLQQIVTVGQEIVWMTGDPGIVDPVRDIVQMALDERADIDNFMARVSNAASLLPVISFFNDMLGFQARVNQRRQMFAARLKALISYYDGRSSA